MDFNPQSYAPDGTAIFANDGQLLVKFFRHPEISQIKSVKANLPIYDNVDMISVIQPGEKEEIKVLATDMHKRRFPKQWEAYEKGQELAQSGTPLDHLFPSDPGAILNLKAFNIFTVQQLAAVTDSALANIPMGRTLCEKAKAYLNSAAANTNQIEEMQKQIDALKSQLTASPDTETPPQTEAKRGPGRPRATQPAV